MYSISTIPYHLHIKIIISLKSSHAIIIHIVDFYRKNTVST